MPPSSDRSAACNTVRNALRMIIAALSIFLCVYPAACEDVLILTAPGCAKCAAAHRVLDDVLSSHGDVHIQEYTYTSEEGRKIIKEFRVKDVPSIIIDGSVIGYRDYDGNESRLRELIKSALEGRVDTNASSETPYSPEIFGSITLSTALTVLVAGLLAGFNPCLLAILAFLATTVLSSAGRRRDLLLMIFFFSLGILSVYLIFGMGLFRMMQDSNTASMLRLVLSALLILLGMMQLEDARRLNSSGRSLFRTDWILGYFQAAAGARSLAAYFLLGMLFSMVKAPCVGAVYVAIISIIYTKGYASSAIAYLFLYNLGVVLPVMLLGGAIALGMQPESVERFRHEHRVAIRVVTGLTLIALAPLIYWEMI
ncbi:MAG TPA: cytochrome c biogenesis protein CcdA [Methanothrix sp.]|nr:cytochrome c biogenesis protein CcdA [Methanothrix sp.]HOK58716.1 cytochrome c biogenesis protein CcdA [Methanothrix sp.]HOL43888.1 cytochrome c biogenesis protein CcdA [Methanothrix sp.]HPO88944.1 cytochrome c biogenesis protein CcdA [Methanothrix sp.]